MSNTIRGMKRSKAKKKAGWKMFRDATGLPLSVFMNPGNRKNAQKIKDALDGKNK